MTSEEIKKAFGICCNSTQGCTGCPILKIEEQNGLGCKYNLFISTISLITKQEEEIKNLKTQLEQPRKETAKKILDYFDRYAGTGKKLIGNMISEQRKKYGVEVEE